MNILLQYQLTGGILERMERGNFSRASEPEPELGAGATEQASFGRSRSGAGAVFNLNAGAGVGAGAMFEDLAGAGAEPELCLIAMMVPEPSSKIC